MNNPTQKKKGFNIQSIVVVGIMAALVFVGTFIHIDIPTPIGSTMIHFGNVMCLLAALLFGPLRGGLAAGFGSMLYDLIDPRFLPECWITFLMKFAMAFVAGTIIYSIKNENWDGPSRARQLIGALCGSLTYVVLYTVKNYIRDYLILGLEIETVVATLVIKSTTSLTNGVIAVVASLLLSAAIKPALKRTSLGQRLGVR